MVNTVSDQWTQAGGRDVMLQPVVDTHMFSTHSSLPIKLVLFQWKRGKMPPLFFPASVHLPVNLQAPTRSHLRLKDAAVKERKYNIAGWTLGSHKDMFHECLLGLFENYSTFVWSHTPRFLKCQKTHFWKSSIWSDIWQEPVSCKVHSHVMLMGHRKEKESSCQSSRSQSIVPW